MSALADIASCSRVPEQGSRFDAVVVGAGPAGSAAALGLARSGLSTLLVERRALPRDKVCGCCLGHATLRAIRRLGLGEEIARLGAPLTGVQIVVGRTRLTLDLVEGIALARARLDAALARSAVEAGAVLCAPATAVLGPADRDARRVRLRTPSGDVEVAARLVIAADGLGGNLLRGGVTPRLPSKLATRIGLGGIVDEPPGEYVPGEITMAVDRSGYAGLVRLGDGRLNVAACVDPRAIRERGGAPAAVAAILRSAGLPEIPPATRLEGTRAFRFRPRHVVAERVLSIGDAAGFWEPGSGEGIAWALDAGIAVAEPANRLVRRWDRAYASRWGRAYRLWIRRRQRLSRILGALAARPALASHVARWVADRPGTLDRVFPRQTLVRAARGNGALA